MQKYWSLCYYWNRTLVSITPILNHICHTSCWQVSITSAQFLDLAHNQSYRKMTLCVMGLPLGLIHWMALWMLVGIKRRMWECRTLTVGISSRTVKLPFISELIYHKELNAAATQTYSTFRFLTLCWIWLLFFHWMFFLFTDWTKKTYKEGNTKYTNWQKHFILDFWTFEML